MACVSVLRKEDSHKVRAEVSTSIPVSVLQQLRCKYPNDSLRVTTEDGVCIIEIDMNTNNTRDNWKNERELGILKTFRDCGVFGNEPVHIHYLDTSTVLH